MSIHAQKFYALDFFAGSGLATEALKESFNILWANDFCEKKANVYLENHSSKKLNGEDKKVKQFLDNGEKSFFLGDISEIEGNAFPKTTVSWASFPCQDLSLAGNLGGINGTRSGLVWHWLRIMDEMVESPSILVAENVTGLISSNNGGYYKLLHKALVARGYKVGPVVLDASRWLPHSRPRVFVIAVRSSVDSSDLERVNAGWAQNSSIQKIAAGLENFVWWDLPEPPERKNSLADIVDFGAPIDNLKASKRSLALIPDRHLTKLQESIDSLKAVPGYKRTRDKQVLELRFDGIAGCLRTPQGGSSRQWLILKPNGDFASRLLTTREAARLMGAPDTYKLPGTYNDGYKAMGDAVAVPVVRYLAENLLVPLAQRSDV